MGIDKEETFLTMFFIAVSCLIIGLLLNVVDKRDRDLLEWRSHSNISPTLKH